MSLISQASRLLPLLVEPIVRSEKEEDEGKEVSRFSCLPRTMSFLRLQILVLPSQERGREDEIRAQELSDDDVHRLARSIQLFFIPSGRFFSLSRLSRHLVVSTSPRPSSAAALFRTLEFFLTHISALAHVRDTQHVLSRPCLLAPPSPLPSQAAPRVGHQQSSVPAVIVYAFARSA
jgi:hypothetical protein